MKRCMKMPGLLPTRSIGASSKTRSSSARNLARGKTEKAREERASGAGTANLVRVQSQNLNLNMGLLSAQFRAYGGTGNRSKAPESGVDNMRRKFFGNGADSENKFGSQYVSSGSEHEFNSVCLGAMVNGFIENEADSGRCGRTRCNCESSGSLCDCSDFDDSRSSLGGELSEILLELVSNPSATERTLAAEVTKAITVANGVVSAEDGDSSNVNRQVMKHLRAAGYNAAICKSRWDHAGSFPGGDYEYIDVLFEGPTKKSERIIIDIDFRAQFEIARPTSSYNALVQVLPTVFVGKADILLQVVSVVSDAVNQSLKKRDMHLPPWRTVEYMRARWFSSYKRTINGSVQKVRSDIVSNISRIAVRDSCWNAKYTNEMEVDYFRGPDRRILKDSHLAEKKPAEPAYKPSAPLAVRLAVDNNQWQPPALKPRVFQAPGQAGLALILRESGLTSSIRTLTEEGRTERKSLPIPV